MTYQIDQSFYQYLAGWNTKTLVRNYCDIIAIKGNIKFETDVKDYIVDWEDDHSIDKWGDKGKVDKENDNPREPPHNSNNCSDHSTFRMLIIKD